MSDGSASDQAKVTSFKIDLQLYATVSINGEAWVKPGVSTGMTWNSIPSKESIKTAISFMSEEIIDPTIKDVMESVTEATKKSKGIK